MYKKNLALNYLQGLMPTNLTIFGINHPIKVLICRYIKQTSKFDFTKRNNIFYFLLLLLPLLFKYFIVNPHLEVSARLTQWLSSYEMESAIQVQNPGRG